MTVTELAPVQVAPAVARRWPGRAMPVLPALVTLLVGGYRAGARQLWEDEYATWHASTLGAADFVRLISHVDFALAPYYLFMQGWIDLFGDSLLALRAPSVLAMAGTAGLLAVLGRRLFNSGVGLLAGLMFAAVPSVSRYAQEARPYAIAMLLTVAATILLLSAIDRPTWPRWLTYGLVIVLAGLAHLVTVAILGAHFVAVSYSARERETLRPWRWLAAVVLTAVVLGPFAITASRQTGAISWIQADSASLRSFPGQLFGSGAVAAAVVGLAVVGLYLRVRTAGVHLPLLTAWALLPPLLTFVTFPLLHLFEYRYLLFTLPAWILLAAAGVTASARRRMVAVAAGGLALVLIAVVGWPGQLNARHDPVLGYPDYRQAAEIIRARLQPGDAIAYGGLYFRARRAMTYENRDQLRPRDVFLAESAEQLGGYVARECSQPAACLGPTRRIWLVNTTLSANVYAELSPAMAQLLQDRCTVVTAWSLAHLHLVLLAVHSP